MWMNCANVNNAINANSSQLISNGDSKNYILLEISMIAWSVWIECKPIWFKLNRTLDHYFYWQNAFRFVSFFPRRSWHLACHQFIADFKWNTRIRATYVAIFHPENKAKQDVWKLWDETANQFLAEGKILHSILSTANKYRW